MDNLKRIDLYRDISGHTFMPPDTEGGRVQRAARKVLISRERGMVHVMSKDPYIDPAYAESWAGLAQALPNMTVVLPRLQDFFKWSDHLLPKGSSGGSDLYVVPDKADCFSGPNKKKFLISNSHHINFGYGEDKNNNLVAHHGVE